jgi:hypothetical protein
MKRMVERTITEGVTHHIRNPVRVYSEDPVQADRINRTREMCRLAMKGFEFARKGKLKMVEVGCGAADIAGWLAKNYTEWHATGIDCNTGCLIEATLRYAPNFIGIHGAITQAGYGPPVDLVILSEVLEHLDDPTAVAGSWLRRARTSVISHPLDEPEHSQLSGGDHTWSLSEKDHRAFFEAGGHVVDETVTFQEAAFTIILSRGHKRE